MKQEMTVAAAMLLAIAVIGCGGGGAASGSGGSGSGGTGNGSGGTSGAVTCGGTTTGAVTTVLAKEANDYAFSSTLTFPPVTVKPGTELTFDWGSVTKDFIGHPLTATTDINTVLILMWNLTLDELQTKINADTPQMRDLVVLPLTYPPTGGTTTAKLFDFTLNGSQISSDMVLPYFDIGMYPPDKNLYTLMAATGTTLGQGTRMIQSFKLDAASTNTTVKMDDASTQLTYTANLHDLQAMGIPAGTAAVQLDWKDMKTNALGVEFVSTKITSALVGHYTQTPTELEAKFLDLDLIATDLYEGNIASGTVVDFSTLKTSTGKPFPGIDDTGTWVVGLRCGGCRNPAPWYLSVLKPCK